ncbi:AAA family ATPase [Thermoproteota archaeon]
MGKAKVIGVISIKGGVGKTSCVTNLGAAIANDFGKKVLIIDANFSAPNLGLHFGLVNPDMTLHDVLNGKIKPDEAIYAISDNFHLMPASPLSKKTKPLALKKKIKSLRSHYDMILIDSSPTLNDEILATMMASDELIVVSSPDYPTLYCTLHAVKAAKQKRTPIVGLILNRVKRKSFELQISDIEEAANAPVIAVINDDVNMLEALSLTTPVTQHNPYSSSSVEYKKLAATLIGGYYEDPRLLEKVKTAFRRETPIEEVNRFILRDKINGGPGLPKQ